ncbi:SRPBCC family protein [Kribbella sp. NPDC003505]|uniref:SRPBCC family protein n=1 Tax=Kribbella sp. NPDC003505 TaxID=3154448 RepID=UPI0033B86A64
MDVAASLVIDAAPEITYAVYGDYERWPQTFPTISRVWRLRQDGDEFLVAVDHVEGIVTNRLIFRSPQQIELREEKRHFDAVFQNRFEAVADGTLFTVEASIRFKGWARLLRPFLRGYVRRRIERYVLRPVQRVSEALQHDGEQ